MRIVDRDERPKIDVVRSSVVDDKRRDKMLRWAFWVAFLIATMCAFAWKVTSASIA
jgi:hypothetical protein